MEHEIDDILAKYFSHNAKANEIEFVEQWKDASKENEEIFKHYKLLWLQSENEFSFTPNVNEALKNVSENLDRIEKPERTLAVARILVYAAGLALIITTLLVMWGQQKSPNMIVAETKTQKIDILLPDGTRVWLNTNTKIEYPNEFESNNRTVFFEGEAYFDVAANAKKPFIIESKNTNTTVVGTEFNLIATEKINKILITEGKVKFKSNEDEILLKTGEEAEINANKKLVKNRNSNYNALAWKTGKLAYKDSELSTVFADLEKLYSTNFMFDNQDVNTIKINANFENKTVKEIIDFLLLTIPEINISNNSNVYTVSIKE